MVFKALNKKIVFYEKTGCAGNARQKKLLSSSGLSFEVRSILDTIWDKESLNSFFKELNKEEIVNPFAPKIKRGELDISSLSKDELIELMIKEPILIKRPLLDIDGTKICGFDMQKINSLLNIDLCPDITISTCQSNDRCTTA